MKIHLIYEGQIFEFLSMSWDNWVKVQIAIKIVWLRLDCPDIYGSANYSVY